MVQESDCRSEKSTVTYTWWPPARTATSATSPTAMIWTFPKTRTMCTSARTETIHGVTWNKLPNTKGHLLVSDQSSMFLSRPCNVADYGMIYAGVQKNVGPAGMVVAIIREDLIRDSAELDPKTPIYMSYKTHADNGSMYNTPPTAGQSTAAARSSSTLRASAAWRRWNGGTSTRPR